MAEADWFSKFINDLYAIEEKLRWVVPAGSKNLYFKVVRIKGRSSHGEIAVGKPLYTLCWTLRNEGFPKLKEAIADLHLRYDVLRSER